MNVFRLSLLALLGALALTACPNALTASPSALEVTVTGLPNGTNADITVSGPNGFSQTLNAAKTLSNLEPGSYTVTAKTVTSGGMTYTASITGSPATVTAGGTVLSSVSYAAMTPTTPPAPPTLPTPPTPPPTPPTPPAPPTPPIATGALQVDVTFTIGTAVPNVTVTGPGGFSQTLTGSKTLINLTPGNYAVTAATVTSNGFTYLARVSGSTVAVSAGATAKASVTYAAQVGTLQIKVTGLPSGVKTSLTVHRPNGLTDVLNNTLVSASDELPVGTYTISAAPVRLTGSVVDLIFESAGVSAANVTAGTTTIVTVSYVPRPGATALWLPKVGGSVIAYAASKLGFGGNSLALPSVTLSGAAGGGNASVAFDASGNLWALNSATNTLNRFDAVQLGSSGTPVPAVTISSSAGSLSRPASLVFDRNGNLWIANLGNDTIVMLTPYQLSQSGSPTPGLVISANTSQFDPSLHGVSSLAFDKDGNLWALNGAAPENVVRFSPDQLMRSGTPAAAFSLTPGLSAAADIAFDAAGNLWITDYGASAVVKYAAAQLVPGSNPGQATWIRSINGSLANPAGLAFDSSGNLWVANAGNNTLVEFAADQLPASPSADSPEAASIISDIRDLALGSMAFNPAPLNLPLAH
jgi:sugar lactone lactonase YvrE